jgi:type II secretory pathway predicted ATPase ExeA
MTHSELRRTLHILMNYEWDRRALLSLVLVGLPELQARLERRHNRSLYSRLHTRLRIDPLVPDDSAEYIRHRLHLAGCDREIVTSDAIAMLHEATLGALRDLDRLATAALRLAARRKKKLVERDLVAHVIDADSRAND